MSKERLSTFGERRRKFVCGIAGLAGAAVLSKLGADYLFGISSQQTPQTPKLDYVETPQIDLSKDIENLKSLEKRLDRRGLIGRDIYCGNVNAYSERANLADKLGKHYEKGKEVLRIPRHVQSVYQDKVSEIRIVYIDDGANEYKSKLDVLAENIRKNLQQLMPDVKFSIDYSIYPESSVRQRSIGFSETTEDESIVDKSLMLGTRRKFLVLGPNMNPFLLGRSFGSSFPLGNFATVNTAELGKYADPSEINRLIKISAHELGHTLGVLHCAEERCFMQPHGGTTFWDRCRAIGKNLSNGEIVLDREKIYKSPRLISEAEDRRLLAENLKNLLIWAYGDSLYKPYETWGMEVYLGDKQDRVEVSKDGTKFGEILLSTFVDKVNVT